MNVSDQVTRSYIAYFKARHVSLDADDLALAARPFNIAAVQAFVDADIEKFAQQEPREAASRRILRERYHERNLRLITEQYAGHVLTRYQQNEPLNESVYLQECRMIKTAGGFDCDLYPC